MPIACQHKQLHGPQFCIADCPVNAPCGVFDYYRIDHAGEVLPPRDESFIDVAVLDMNHGWPNLGHDSLVHLVQDASCDLMEPLLALGLKLRVISFDVRKGAAIPEFPGGRFPIYVGTGGPGHLNPHCNDGSSPGSQGIRENPSWEAPIFSLLDAVHDHPDAVLLAVCHTFGVMCRWGGIGKPQLRGPEKGGKSTGVLENLLTPEAHNHPWFGELARQSRNDRVRIMDNRLFDMIPENHWNNGLLPIAYETNGIGGPRGESITMLEWARDRAGIMPRMFGVNHHPEVVDRGRQLLILQRKREAGNVSETWYQERYELLTRTYPEEDSERRLALTSDYTLVGPLRYYLYREVRKKAESLGRKIPIHEDKFLESPFLTKNR